MNSAYIQPIMLPEQKYISHDLSALVNLTHHFIKTFSHLDLIKLER